MITVLDSIVIAFVALAVIEIVKYFRHDDAVVTALQEGRQIFTGLGAVATLSLVGAFALMIWVVVNGYLTSAAGFDLLAGIAWGVFIYFLRYRAIKARI